MKRRMRLAIMGSHIIPYRTPLYRHLADSSEVDLLVVYGDTYGAKPRESPWGVSDFVWDGDHLSGYRHVFLENIASKPHPSTFFGKINPELASTLSKFKPDATLVMGYMGLYQLAAMLCSKALRSRLLYTSDTNALSDPSGGKGAAKRAAVGGLYTQVDTFLVTGTRNREHYEAFGVPSEKMYEFPWAVDTTHFFSQARAFAPQREALRRSFGVPPNATCVVAVSKLDANKNVSELVRAAALIPEAYLLVAGSGPERDRLGQQADALLPGRHRFLGFLNQNDLGRAYAAADVFALCSVREAWGLTCNEAMCFGLPIVVAGSVGCGVDLAVSGKTGQVYRLGDVQGLAKALSESAELGRNPSTRNEIQSLVRCYSSSSQAEGLLRALRGDREQYPSHFPRFC